jgi:hypothetical protein
MMRLKQFMNFHNKKFEEVGEENDEWRIKNYNFCGN